MNNSKNNSLVHICIPCYNAEKTIAETVQSIQNQTYTNLQIHISDNASTDNTISILNEFAQKDPRIVIHAFKENVGGEGNFNRCITLGGGDYTAIYHADDIFTETMVEEEVRFLDSHQEIGAVFTGGLFIDDKSKVVGKYSKTPNVRSKESNITFSFQELFRCILDTGNFLICPSAMVRTLIYKTEIQAWNSSQFKTSSDLDVWLRIATKHDIGYIRKPLIKYRVSTSSYTFRVQATLTEPHDFLSVIEYYFKSDSWVHRKVDWLNYNRQFFKDCITRARNCVLMGEQKKANCILSSALKYIHINSFAQKKYYYWIVQLIVVWMGSFLPGGSKLINWLLYQKQKRWLY